MEGRPRTAAPLEVIRTPSSAYAPATAVASPRSIAGNQPELAASIAFLADAIRVTGSGLDAPCARPACAKLGRARRSSAAAAVSSAIGMTAEPAPRWLG